MRILIGGICQESNTFSPVRTTLEQARKQLFFTGAGVTGFRTRNELGGFMASADRECVEYVPSLFTKITSSGMFDAQDYLKLKGMFLEHVRRAMVEGGPIDGVFMAMHGAMVAENCDDVEGDIAAMIREEIGEELPFVVSLDPHANVTRQLVASANGIVGFRTYPHIDIYETGERAAKLLFAMARGEMAPAMAMRKLPMIVPAENSQSMYGPFAELLAEAEAGEAGGDSVCTSLFPTQPWIDVDELGFSVTVVASSQELAEREADRLAELIWDKRHAFEVELQPVARMVERALALQSRGEERKPLVLSDSADSPSAGASGDSSYVLGQLLAANAHERLVCFVNVTDPQSAAKAIEAGVGAEVELQVGYSINPLYEGTPVPVRGKVVQIGDGKFRLGSLDRPVSMGKCAVVRTGKLFLLVHEQATTSSDPAMYRSVGLEPAEADIVVVRSANQFRADYAPIAREMHILDSPGCSTADLRKLDFRKIRRPFYPYDDGFDWRDRP